MGHPHLHSYLVILVTTRNIKEENTTKNNTSDKASARRMTFFYLVVWSFYPICKSLEIFTYDEEELLGINIHKLVPSVELVKSLKSPIFV